MNPDVLRIALVADGSSDRMLLPIIEWAIRRRRPDVGVLVTGVRARVGGDLAQAMHSAAAGYTPDLLFVHRDAERMPLEARRREIPTHDGLVVRIVPVRMTEAWLFIDEDAIRRASGNPHGRVRLELPAARKLEGRPDPKALLRELLQTASGPGGPRRLKRLHRDLPELVQRVAHLIGDFSPLQALPAFEASTMSCERPSTAYPGVSRRYPALPIHS
jgi:hypothetical protein